MRSFSVILVIAFCSQAHVPHVKVLLANNQTAQDNMDKVLDKFVDKLVSGINKRWPLKRADLDSSMLSQKKSSSSSGRNLVSGIYKRWPLKRADLDNSMLQKKSGSGGRLGGSAFGRKKAAPEASTVAATQQAPPVQQHHHYHPQPMYHPAPMWQPPMFIPIFNPFSLFDSRRRAVIIQETTIINHYANGTTQAVPQHQHHGMGQGQPVMATASVAAPSPALVIPTTKPPEKGPIESFQDMVGGAFSGISNAMPWAPKPAPAV